MLHALAGKKIWICTLGCRSNQYEGEALANAFVEAGALLGDAEGYDALVLVSCTVTAVADKKCRQTIRKAIKCSPEVLIAACGCWAQKLSEDEARDLGIHLIVGNRRKAILPTLLAELFLRGRTGFVVCREDIMYSREWDSLFLSRPLLHTRAFVKIQDGCNNFCSYCAVPSVRGFPVSRSSDDVLKEIRSIVSYGCSEVVLTGVHLGLYGQYGDMSLAELVRRVASVDGLSRLRFGSIEPLGINDELLEVLASTPSFQPHLHIPLQSGNENILSLMNRGYSVGYYREILRKIRLILGDDIHISTDVLVGFPGEDDFSFEETLAFIRECRFGKIHVFPFSPREGTKAFFLPKRVSAHEIASRSKRTLLLGEKLMSEYSTRWIGRDVSVLVEKITISEDLNIKKVALNGLTPSFLRVYAIEQGGTTSAMFSSGSEVMVRITDLEGDALKGCLVE